MIRSRLFWEMVLPYLVFLLPAAVLIWSSDGGLAAGLAGVALAGLLLAAHAAVRVAGAVQKLTASVDRMARGGAVAGLRPLPAGHPLAPLADAVRELARTLVFEINACGLANAELREETARLGTVLTGMAEGVLAVGRDERILFANPAAVALLELPVEGLVGRPVWEAVRVPALHQAARQTLSGETPPPVEIDLPRSQTVIALLAGRLPGDPCPGVVLVLHDITELRRLESLRREFVSNVSHELKTPLATIQAYTETLLDGAIHDADNNVKFLRRIAEQADRLHSLILDLAAAGPH